MERVAPGTRPPGKGDLINMIPEELPVQGLVFWPVGNGDSTTVVIDDDHVLQIDLCDLALAREEGAPVAAVVDRLVEILPTASDGKPYLSTFILTHADRDHCQGFADLLDRVTIGELWATPRLWREYEEDGDDASLCDDAVAFQAEAERRVAAVCVAIADGTEPASGDRIRVIGYDTDREKHAYSELPAEYLTYPGDAVTSIDGDDIGNVFEAFVHAPFKDDCAAARNDTSVAIQITLKDGTGVEGHALFFGDLAYETVVKIFDYSERYNRPERLAWDVLLAPHHCSKKVMYVVEEGKDVLKQDVLDAFDRHAGKSATVVVSAAPFSTKDSPGDNPPHLVARNRYEEITNLICSAEYPTPLDAEPIIFALGLSGFELVEPEEEDDSVEKSSSGLTKVLVGAGIGILGGLLARAALAGRQNPEGGRGLDQVRDAVSATRGDTAAPQQPVAFGAT
jgi:hypothetical protein